mmetsp:Transcript_52690/g.138562  ORF Transcript_52690/g.138562 Transcript_52690/m.138562 type:complete len:102 (+) Transcript_52690:368-673(+)
MSIAFTKMTAFLYHNFALPLSRIEIWSEDFPLFAQKLSSYGSPFPNLIGIIDGNFLRTARPGGAGNWISTLDQRVVYLQYERHHWLKFLFILFPNGFVALY